MSQIICIKYQHLVNILADHLNNKLLGKKTMPGKADLKCKHVVARLQQITLMSSSIIWLKQNYSLHTLHVKGSWIVFLMAAPVQSCSLRLCFSPIRLLHTAFYGATTFYPRSNIMVMGMPALKQKLRTMFR